MIYCMKCGSQLPDEAKFCKYCGSSTGIGDVAKSNHVETASAPNVEAVIKPSPIIESETIPLPRMEVETRTIPAPKMVEEVRYNSRVDSAIRHPHKTETVNDYPFSPESEIGSPHKIEMEKEYPTKNNSEARYPHRIGNDRYEGFEHSVKSTLSIPFEKNHQKTAGYYIDSDYHCSLARKNIGGIYNELQNSVEGGKWGFVDASKREVIPLIYDNVSIFKDGFAKVWQNEKCGMINKKGIVVIPLIYSDIAYTSEGFTGVCVNGKWGFINSKGEKVIPHKYNEVTQFEEGMAGACRNGKWGMIDTQGRVLVSFIHQDICQLEDNKGDHPRNFRDAPCISKKPSHVFKPGIIKTSAALLGEAALLFVVNRFLPAEKNNFYWMLVGVTILASFVLIVTVIDSVKGIMNKSND